MNRHFKRELAFLCGTAAFALGLGKVIRERRLSAASPLATGFGLAALGFLAYPARHYSFKGRSVVITGGSRGLGLALARQLLNEGACVTILARDPEELDRAKKDLQHLSHNVFCVVCDITQEHHIDNALAEARACFGKIDVLIHNAGSIAVGPFSSTDDEDFRALFDVHVRSAITLTRYIRPYFRMAGGGRIINISSIGGIMPVPHLSAYVASKFALSGFSEALRAELAQENITVTTAYPGLMRTGSPIQAIFKGDSEREFAWFALGDLTPGLSMPAHRAARRILKAARDGRAQIVVGLPAKAGVLFHSLLPETFAQLNALAARMMPQSSSHQRRTGASSRSLFERLGWAKPLQALQKNAERDFNQERKSDADFNMGLKPRPEPSLI